LGENLCFFLIELDLDATVQQLLKVPQLYVPRIVSGDRGLSIRDCDAIKNDFNAGEIPKDVRRLGGRLG